MFLGNSINLSPGIAELMHWSHLSVCRKGCQGTGCIGAEPAETPGPPEFQGLAETQKPRKRRGCLLLFLFSFLPHFYLVLFQLSGVCVWCDGIEELRVLWERHRTRSISVTKYRDGDEFEFFFFVDLTSSLLSPQIRRDFLWQQIQEQF